MHQLIYTVQYSQPLEYDNYFTINKILSFILYSQSTGAIPCSLVVNTLFQYSEPHNFLPGCLTKFCPLFLKSTFNLEYFRTKFTLVPPTIFRNKQILKGLLCGAIPVQLELIRTWKYGEVYGHFWDLRSYTSFANRMA